MEHDSGLAALEKLEHGLRHVNAELDRLRAGLAALGRELEASAAGQNSLANAAGAGHDAALPGRDRATPTNGGRRTG